MAPNNALRKKTAAEKEALAKLMPPMPGTPSTPARRSRRLAAKTPKQQPAQAKQSGSPQALTNRTEINVDLDFVVLKSNHSLRRCGVAV